MTSRFLKVKNNHSKVKKLNFLLPFCFLLFTLGVFSQQDLPDEIRGYKVYRTKISVSNNSGQTEKKNSGQTNSEAIVTLGEPKATQISLSGITFNISAEISNLQQSGKIDFLTFKDFRINNLPVEIAEYHDSFDVSKNKIIRLPKPVRITVPYRHALFGVLEEQIDSKEYWQVTGRIFVFGHFKKGFFKFKRVIPVDINLQIKNPNTTQ